ncbi:HP0495 family protein [Legionella micdadei]|uniref:UPF0250 protein LMI_1529 n=1 Tax=Legionella micdadei TaxID=451 RepID=A0A098GED2_LEGMI|nr:DUF493 domain-containing protein [Legionella micdadei]ARG97599.1 DUF493 domain-containing protein [Legionella micdadei]ARH00089.1 DUF493 domain-containing protein [Legionella micdadei]KTD27680.1 hypothetical protein Lmic_2000 [Legionella micdadei]NSL17664.1 DUF493 domain-containing protein [Legionella micdadei]CEG60834.1 conserved protein of unknown function [Legionella micdadei]
MTDKKSLIQFPCHFPIKIIGKNTDLFATEIKEITQKHFPDTLEETIVCQESQQGNYLSITVVVYVHDQQSLDALYLELTKHPDIKMVL